MQDIERSKEKDRADALIRALDTIIDTVGQDAKTEKQKKEVEEMRKLRDRIRKQIMPEKATIIAELRPESYGADVYKSRLTGTPERLIQLVSLIIDSIVEDLRDSMKEGKAGGLEKDDFREYVIGEIRDAWKAIKAAENLKVESKEEDEEDEDYCDI